MTHQDGRCILPGLYDSCEMCFPEYQRAKLGTLGRVPEIHTNINHLYMDSIGQCGVILGEQLLGYPPKGSQSFAWSSCSCRLMEGRSQLGAHQHSIEKSKSGAFQIKTDCIGVSVLFSFTNRADHGSISVSFFCEVDSPFFVLMFVFGSG